MVEQVAGLLDEDVHQLQVQLAGVQRLVRVFRGAGRRLQRRQRGLLARLRGGGGLGGATLGFGALGFRTADRRAFGFLALRFGAGGGDAFGFLALRFAACGFFGRQSLGFRLLGGETRGLGFLRGDAFGFEARGLFGRLAFSFRLPFGGETRRFGFFRGDPLGFEACGFF
ncbi:MAG TPA: hypothetical protein VLU41_15620, partial [Ideonella sp.]|nr:hypothetical protein [Ideonella sp.]